MRWSIRLQLLVPILLIVALALLLVSSISAWLVSAGQRAQQDEDLQRLSRTLARASFPLTENVLQQMRGLSGAEFVLLDRAGRFRRGTLSLTPGEEALLRRIKTGPRSGGFSDSPVVGLRGRSYLVQRLPIQRQRTAMEPGSLVVLYPEHRWWARGREGVYAVLAVGTITVLVVVLVIGVLAQRFIGKIRRVVHQAAAIAGGDFTPLPAGRGDDEFRDLAVAINQMARRLGHYQELVRRNERLRTLDQLGAGMAHQLRNSATGALLAVELHQRECPGAAGGESLEVAVQQLKLIESYLQRFLTLGAGRPAPEEEVALEAVVEEVLDLVRPVWTHAGTRLEFERSAGTLWVRGDRESLQHLVVNLILNAIEAASRSGNAVGWVAVELDRSDGNAVLHVKDSGRGPAPGTSGSMFEPFVTEKPDGTGLGLWVARRIAEAHGGTITWQRDGATTCFTLAIPLVRAGSHHDTRADR